MKLKNPLRIIGIDPQTPTVIDFRLTSLATALIGFNALLTLLALGLAFAALYR